MKTKLLVCLVFLCFGWVLLVGTVHSAKVWHRPERVPISSLAPAPENGIPPASNYKYPVNGIKYSGTCTDIAPQVGTVIEHTQIGDTWYDFQQNGSMGRMISVTNQGYRNFSWMYVNGVYPGNPRYVRANCEDSTNVYSGATNADGGSTNAGYCNQTHLHDGTSLIIHHRADGTPTWYTTITAANGLGSTLFDRHWDIPDYHSNLPTDIPGEWPKGVVLYDSATGRDYIHVVMAQGETSSDISYLIAYERCYIKDGPGLLDTMICQCFLDDSTKTYKVVAGRNGGGAFAPISHFDISCGINAVVTVSPISSRLAIGYLKPTCDGSCDYLSDVCYIESMVNGDDWVAGSPWPPPVYNITNYGCSGNERGSNDLSACYDYQDSLHIVYVTVGFDPSEPGYYFPGVARLYHWSKRTGIGLIANKIQNNTNPGSHNINIAKMSISAQNPVYHPTGDSVYLFTIWTQFDSADQSAQGFGNGDLFGCGSLDGGATWGGAFNLTNTQTPNCAPGNCLSEHWSSMAQNMYDGDLHIEYICDKDPGSAVGGMDYGSTWQDNPVMYLSIDFEAPPPPPCVTFRILSPASWYGPPLKILPNGTRNLIFEICNCGLSTLIYTVNSDHSCIQVSVPPTGIPHQQCDTITAIIPGNGVCNNTFISGNIIINTNDPGQPRIQLPVQAIVANDYYECPRDPETFDTLNNGVLSFYVNANSQEWIHDISTRPDTSFEVFFQGGPFVATTESNDTLVGRYYGDNDQHTLAREKLYLNSMYNDFWLEYSWNVSIHKLNPPMDNKWWWFDILHENIFFKPTAPDALKHCVIKFVTAERHDPPVWWPSQPAFTGYEDTYIGMMMDMDAPADTLGFQNGRNWAGYDATNSIAWQRGWDYTGMHPEYNNYYAGMALIAGRQPGESLVPYGTYNLVNDVYLYPQAPWGWKDGQFYQLAKGNVIGAIQDPDSIVDRSQIVTARKIDAGSDVNARASFTIVETFSSTGLAQLQSRVAAAREWVGSAHMNHILCCDVNNNGLIDIGDIIALIDYLYKNYPPSIISGPKERADVNSSGAVEVGDVVTLINYLFKGYAESALKCPGVW